MHVGQREYTTGERPFRGATFSLVHGSCQVSVGERWGTVPIRGGHQQLTGLNRSDLRQIAVDRLQLLLAFSLAELATLAVF